MKAIVTGANGFIGKQLVNKLTDNGIEVLAIDISFINSDFYKNKHVKILEMSIENIGSITSTICDGEYDLFYHLAWIGVNGPEKKEITSQLKNIEMAIKCATIAKAIGCKKILYAGTIAERCVNSLSKLSSVGPAMVYGVTKYATHLLLETYCKNIGLNFVWMQFSNIYGPSNKTGNIISYTLVQLRRGEIAAFGPAQQPYDFIFVDDLIEAVYRLGTKKTKKSFYFVGSGTPRILSKYLLSIGALFGKPELIHIGERQDDGIEYSFEMMNNTDLVEEIGEYVSGSFEELMKYTIENTIGENK